MGDMRNVFLMTYAVSLVTLFRVKYLLKSNHPKNHDDIFGKSFLDYSANHSIKIIRFTMRKGQWDFIQDSSLLTWLKINLVVSYFFFSFIPILLIYVTYHAMYVI